MYIIQKHRDILSFILFVISLIFMKEMNYLFYDSTLSPDYSEYSVYLNHFANTDVVTQREHGLMYYYLQYINYYVQYNEFGQNQFLLHKSIQQTNFYIFIVGLIGFYKILRHFNFQKSSIFLTFIFINFFPVSVVQRIVFKPEILAFALLPWILFCIEKYKEEKNVYYLYLSIPILVSCLTLKGNVLVIISVYIFITNLKLLIEINKRHLLFLISLFLLSITFLNFENSSANNKSLLDVQSGATLNEKYDFKASPKIIYHTDIYDILTSPIKHDHADSFIAITLLETTGDYFDLYWDSDCCNYFKDRKEFVKFEVSERIQPPIISVEDKELTIFIQKETDIYLNQTIGLFLSLFFYSILIKSVFQNKKYRSYLLATFLGMGLLLFHSISGIPVNNFDPNVGDTYKPHYYSFLFLLSTIFLVIGLIGKKKNRIFLIIYILFSFINFGLLKTPTISFNNDITPYIEYSTFCEISKPLLINNYGLDDVECFNGDGISSIAWEEVYENGFAIKKFNITALISTFLIMLYLTSKKIKIIT